MLICVFYGAFLSIIYFRIRVSVLQEPEFNMLLNSTGIINKKHVFIKLFYCHSMTRNIPAERRSLLNILVHKYYINNS